MQVNAFALLMNAQAEWSRLTHLPSLIAEPRNSKQRLRNDMIEFLRNASGQHQMSRLMAIASLKQSLMLIGP